jgi:hypothetical protein
MQTSKQYKALIQVTNLLNGYKLRNIDVLGNENSQSNFTKFYHFLKSPESVNEDLAAQHIGYIGKDDPNYRRFRVDFKNKLLHTVLFIDSSSPAFKERSQAFLRCHLQYSIIQILQIAGIHDAVLIYSNEVLEQSLKFEVTEVSLGIAKMLRNLHVQKYKNKKEYEKYRDLSKKLESEYDFERKSDEYLDHIFSFYVKSIDIQPEVFDLASAYYNELYIHFQQSPTLLLGSKLYQIALIKHLSRLDYKSVIEVCNRALLFLESKPYETANFKTVFVNNKLTALLHTRQYILAREVSNNILTYPLKGTTNWFNSLERCIRLELHCNNVARAFELFKEGIEHKNFQYRPQLGKEDWYLIEGYFSLFEKMGILPQGSIKFKVKKFLNQTEMSQQDKEGRNVGVQILVVLHQLIDKKYEGLDNRMETLTRYRNRYLKGDQHTRSYLFIQIIKSLVKAGFNFKTAKPNVDSFFNLLLEEDYDYNNPQHLLEVIPFHVFWEGYGLRLAA